VFLGIGHNQANDKAGIMSCFISLTDWREFLCERPERTDFIKKQPSMRPNISDDIWPTIPFDH
jgi:hypothetical protein